MKTTLIIPTLNEIIGLKEIMPQIDPSWVDEILFIDGHSTDGTLEYIKEHGYKCILQKEPGGIAAWWESMEAASGDAIIFFSPDGNSDPKAIPRLIQKAKEGYNVVIASRYMNGERSDDDSFLTYIANQFLTGLINFVYDSNYTDALVMYKIFHKDLIKQLHLDNDKKSIFEILLAVRCAKHKIKVTEIPAKEFQRIDGTDSRVHIGIKGRIKGGLHMLWTIFKEII